MSFKLCQFEPDGNAYKCVYCGTRRLHPLNRECNRAGLGDALESFLASHGVSKEWYIEFKNKYGYPPTCDCDERKEWLNKTAAAHPTIANIGVKFLAAITRKK